jgi:hypothetical protein
VFVWDTAGAISKKVSRNSLLNSGTLAGASAPITVSQTWNDAAVAFTAFKVNAVSTASATASLLLDLQVGGVSKFSVDKAGNITSASIGPSSISTTTGFFGGSVRLNTNDAFLSFGSPQSVFLQRDGAANTLALRNGTNGQKFSVYGTYPGADTWERFTITAPTSGNVLLGTYRGTSGVARGLEFQVDGSTRLTFPVSGNPTFATAVTFGLDINGQRDVYCGAGRHFRYPNNSAFTSAGAGIVVFEDLGASNATPRFQLGGTSNLFPSLKRSTTYLQARLADDSAFAPIQGKLTTDTAYTGTTVVPTGFITLYDSTGTAYKVPCVAA